MKLIFIFCISVQESKLHEASTSTAVHIGEMELVTRNPQELHEITSLIAELMPPLPAGKKFKKSISIRKIFLRVFIFGWH